MNELFLYDRDKGLFKEILKTSTVMEGRYFVVSSGFDFSSTDLNGLIGQKYPCVICAIPRINFLTQSQRSVLFTLYFLTRFAHTGQGDIKDVAPDTLTTNHPSWYDWKDMDECAMNFLKMLKNVVQKSLMGAGLGFNNVQAPTIQYITKAGNDVVNGAKLSFSMVVPSIVCETNDYAGVSVSDITIPPFEIHALHKH